MFRRSLAAVVVLCVISSLVVAGTLEGVITKASDKEITVKTKKDKKDKEYSGDVKTININKDTKFFTQKGKDEAKESSLGDATEAVKKAADNEKNPLKGARATIETEGEGDKEVATKVTLKQRGKKN